MRLPHTITKENSWLIQLLDEVPLEGHALSLRCLYVVPVSTLSGTTGNQSVAQSHCSQPPSLTPWLPASVTHSPQQNLELSLTLCAASVWPCVNLCVWATGSLSTSLCWWFSGWENLSLWMLSLPLNCKKSPWSKFPPENFSLQKFNLLISRRVFQMTLKLP